MWYPYRQTSSGSSCIRKDRRVRFAFIALLAVLLYADFALAGISQQPIGDVYHTSWTTRDGAPRGVTALAETRDGYLWVGTILGLYRFDGTHFTDYPDTDGPALPSNNITALVADEDNGVWIGYDHRGVSHLAKGRIENISLPSPYENVSVGSLYCCAQHSLWALAGDTILRWHDGTWEDFASLHGLPHTTYFSLFFDSHGNVWASSRQTIYEMKASETRFALVSKAVFAITQFAQAPDGAIWISDGWNSLRPLNSLCSKTSIPLHGTAAFLFDKSGRLWVSSDGHGVERIPPLGSSCQSVKTKEPFTAESGLTSDLTHAILQDRWGDIWVGTEMGLDRFRPRRFQPFGQQDFKFYPAIAAAPDGSIWLQEQGRSLVHVTEEGARTIGPLRGVSPLAADANSGVWLLDPWTHHLFHYDRRGDLERTVAPPPSVSQTAAQSILCRPDGSLLVSFEGNGLWSYSDAWKPVSAVPDKTPTTLTQEGETTWVGYFDNTLLSLSGDRRQTYDTNQGLDVETPLVVTRQESVLWVGGTNGVDFMLNGRFLKLQVRAPERLRGVSGVVFDTNRNLWLNTGFGAMEIGANEVASVLQDPSHRAVAKVYGTADGVIGIPAQTKPVPSLARDGDGHLWFATAGNLVSISPNDLATPRPMPFLDLQTVRINGKKLSTAGANGERLVLQGGRENRIEFQFTAVDLDHPNHIIYRYRLQGEDTDWQMARTNHEAIYNKLQPGHYIFQVAATNGEDQWTEMSSPFRFDIRPAFYQTIWFLVACWGLALLCLWLLYLARVQFLNARLRDRLEQRSNERLRIARELHDTLLQSIHGLMLRFHYAAASLEPDSSAKPALDAALKRADTLILEGRNSVQDLRGEADKDKRLSDMLAEAVRDLTTGNAPAVKISEEGIAHPLRTLVQEEFCKIGREAIGNALRHANPTQIKVEIHYGRRLFRLTCRDDGAGIPDDIVHAAGRNGHWGLKGMRERARSVGATFSLWTSEGKGTEVEVRLYSSAAYDRPSFWNRLFGLPRRTSPSRAGMN